MIPQYFGDRCPQCGASSRILVALKLSRGNNTHSHRIVIEWMPAFLPNGQWCRFCGWLNGRP